MEEHYPAILRQYMGEERNGGSQDYDQISKQAADICGRCQGTSNAAKGTEPVSREERSAFGEKIKPIEESLLRNYAIQNEYWIAENNFLDKYKERYIGAGAEQKVYLSENGFDVLKVNKGRFHNNWLEYFNRLLFHRYLFPSTKYITIGFTEDEGVFSVITQQQFAILSQGAHREIVEKYLNKHDFIRFKNDDYYNKNIGVKLEDLHDENVFLDDNQNLLFIDPVIYFETTDMKLGGKYIFHFPFTESIK